MSPLKSFDMALAGAGVGGPSTPWAAGAGVSRGPLPSRKGHPFEALLNEPDFGRVMPSPKEREADPVLEKIVRDDRAWQSHIRVLLGEHFNLGTGDSVVVETNVQDETTPKFHFPTRPRRKRRSTS